MQYIEKEKKKGRKRRYIGYGKSLQCISFQKGIKKFF